MSKETPMSLPLDQALALSEDLADEAQQQGLHCHAVVARCPNSKNLYWVWFESDPHAAPEAPASLQPFIDGRYS